MKKNKLTRWIVIITVFIVVFVLLGKKCGFIGDKGVIEVAVDKVEKRNITETVSANGKVQPEKQVKITSEVPGEIIELYVKEGQQVKQGDLLCKINPEIYLSNIDRMEAALNTAKANLANAKARLSQVKAQYISAKSSYERNEKLWKEKVISDAEFETIKSQYEVAKAEVEAAEQSVFASDFNVKSAEAALNEAQKNLTKTSIYAPVDGTVSKLNVEKGEKVVGTSQFAGTEIMTIANLNEMEVSVDVNENDIVRVKLGDTADIDIDAYIDRKFKGVVSEIATTANTTGLTVDQVTNFTVKIRILRSSYEDLLQGKPAEYSPFRPGMSATVDIQTNKAFNVLTVPIQSVTTRVDSVELEMKKQARGDKQEEDNNQTEIKDKTKLDELVFVYDNGIVRQRKVKTGIQDNSYIEIKSGLSEGEEVVSAPYRAISKRLKDGDKVIKVDKKDLFEKGKKKSD